MVLNRLALSYSGLGMNYPRLLGEVLRRGMIVPSRLGNTMEVLNLQLSVWNVERSLVGRDGMSEAFAHEEIRQLFAGTYDGARLGAIVPRAAELITPATAYGPRAIAQLPLVEKELRENPGSRRAVVYIGRERDLLSMHVPLLSDRAAGEMPCTCVWQFHVRDDKLFMSVYMRSWDLVWGLSYDVPSFTAVQRVLANVLGYRLGSYTHTAGSAHIYERHWDIEVWERDDELDLSAYDGLSTWSEVLQRARSL